VTIIIADLTGDLLQEALKKYLEPPHKILAVIGGVEQTID
jgi:hypothetical protein